MIQPQYHIVKRSHIKHSLHHATKQQTYSKWSLGLCSIVPVTKRPITNGPMINILMINSPMINSRMINSSTCMINSPVINSSMTKSPMINGSGANGPQTVSASSQFITVLTLAQGLES